MKELQKMTKMERTLIAIQCDRYFLTINKNKQMVPIFNIIKNSLSLSNAHDKEIWCFLTCVGKSLRSHNKGSQYPLSSTTYDIANKIHGLCLNRSRSSRVIYRLDELGWISLYKGYKIKNCKESHRSYIIFSERLTSLFTCSILNLFSHPVLPAEMVVVKDSKTKLPFFKLTKFRGISDHRGLMVDFNGLLRKTDIALMGVPCAASYKQVFADDLDGAGRFYSFGYFQTMGSSLRSGLTLNGEVTTEVDIKGIHPAIMAILQGLPPTPEDFDPYHVPFDLGLPQKELRLLCKKATMCMINCKTAHGASKAVVNIWKKARDDFPNLHSFDALISRKVIDALVAHNNPLVFFGKGSTGWKVLQRYDSKVCGSILAMFIERGVPILPWHDSWVCPLENRDLLEYCIRESWNEVFGTYEGCVTKVEF